MEILPSNRRETALTTTGSSEPWAIAIRGQYGALPDFASKFTPKVQKYCAQNMVRAIEKDLPTFGRIVAAYGEAGVVKVIATHITDAILRMGEDRDVDTCDVDTIAGAICESDRFKTLRFTTVLGFFHLLKCGEFDIYGKVTPRKILEAFRKYAVEAQAKENRIAYEIDRRTAGEERESSAAEAITWDEYAKRRDLWKNLSAVIGNLAYVLTRIIGWQRKSQNSAKRAGNGPNFAYRCEDD